MSEPTVNVCRSSSVQPSAFGDYPAQLPQPFDSCGQWLLPVSLAYSCVAYTTWFTSTFPLRFPIRFSYFESIFLYLQIFTVFISFFLFIFHFFFFSSVANFQDFCHLLFSELSNFDSILKFYFRCCLYIIFYDPFSQNRSISGHMLFVIFL